MKKDLLAERLAKINAALEEMLGESPSRSVYEETTPEQLGKLFGLTIDQAKAWLENEPNFTSDRFLHEHRNRRGLYRTLITSSTIESHGSENMIYSAVVCMLPC